MTLTEVLKSRRSVRKFAPQSTSRATVEGLLKLTLTTAPSSKNVRSTRFIVVDDPSTLRRISAMRDFGSALIADAPCGVLVLGDGSATDLWLDNAAISATVLQLAATEAGLGSCWVHVNGRPRVSKAPVEGSPAEPAETAAEYLRGFLPIPAEWNPLCFIAMGYPTEPTKPHSEKDDSDKIIFI
ncbi:MAG: nitroreductase family protein [Alistipes sp.]|jgi:nitroreductase|nr:nitroreductase family protein [Alistipes sp.]